jgi:predicted AAA+ superfamily ATPase
VAHEDLTADTIHSYLNYLQEAFVIEKADRYDIKGKKYIGTLSKYYFSDAGLRNAVLGFRQLEETHLMENVLYNELRLRGFRVDVGNIESRRRSPDGSLTRQQLEVDFVANKGSQRFYIQSALSIPDREKMAQESASLRLIPDSFKKVIVVKDAITPWHNEDGILIIGLYDFLLQTDAYLI